MKFNKAQLDVIGMRLKDNFATSAATDRIIIEQQWMRNLRQYRKKYDPEIEKLIPAARSKVYPGDTYVKVTGFEAKMMELMFPASEVNFAIEATPFPNIDQTDLQNIINGLRQQKQQALMQQAQESQDPNQPPQEPPQIDPKEYEPSSEEIEKAVKDFADARAALMQEECEDQLEEVDYPDLAKRVLRSGAKYGLGVTEGPTIRLETEREWQQDNTGAWVAVTNKKPRPVYEHCRVWDVFPDLAAKKWEDQEFIYTRKVFARHELAALKARPDFIEENIDQYLKEHQEGNYKSRAYEIELNVLNLTANISKRDSRKYEVIRYFGFMSGHDVRDCGVEISDNQLSSELLVDFWMLDNTIIKAGLAAFGEKPSDMFHAYIHMDDEDSGLSGVGMPEILRDSQMSRCAVRRMIMDNSAAVSGPIFGIDESKLARGKESQSIHAFSTWYFNSDDNPNFRISDVMQQLSTDSHIGELLELEGKLKEDVDMESNLPSWTLGNAQPLGEAFRTSQNMSQMTGGANVVLKDNVRAFDRYTKSLIGSLVKWNMDPEFNPKKEIKGDFNVQPKGTISLVTKEVRGAAMDQMAQTLTPQDRLYIDNRKLLIERFKARDLPVDLVKSKEECDAADAQQAQMAQMQTQAEAGVNQAKAASLNAKAGKDTADTQKSQEQNQAQIAAILSQVQVNLANAKGTEDRSKLEHIKTLLDSLQQQSDGALKAKEIEQNGQQQAQGAGNKSQGA
jgi:hypothetical protein